jgi:hypothetical protein
VLLLLLLGCQCARLITSRDRVAHLVVRDADLHPLAGSGPELAVELRLAETGYSITYLADDKIGLSPARHAASKLARGPQQCWAPEVQNSLPLTEPELGRDDCHRHR